MSSGTEVSPIAISLDEVNIHFIKAWKCEIFVKIIEDLFPLDTHYESHYAIQSIFL